MGSFLIGHVLYIFAYMSAILKTNSNRSMLDRLMESSWVFMIVFIVITAIAFICVSVMLKDLNTTDPMFFIIPLYAGVLLMHILAGVFTCLIFTTQKLNLRRAGIFIVIAVSLFLFSAALIAMNRFDTQFLIMPNPAVTKSWVQISSLIIMLTYYTPQFLFGKAAFSIGVHLNEDKNDYSIV